jgi:hypothetical protein
MTLATAGEQNTHEFNNGPEESSVWQDLGLFLASSVVASMIGAMLPGARLLRQGHHLGSVLVLLALALIPGGLLAFVMRGLSRSVGGPTTLQRPAIPAGIAVVLAVSIAFAAILHKTTHHHALAGVAFALGEVPLLLVVGALVLRFARYTQTGLAGLIWGGVGCFALLLLSLAMQSGGPGLWLADATGLVLGAAIASISSFLKSRAALALGPPVFAIVLFLGVVNSSRAEVRASLAKESQAYALLMPTRTP